MNTRTITATRYITPLREGGALPVLIEEREASIAYLTRHLDEPRAFSEKAINANAQAHAHTPNPLMTPSSELCHALNAVNSSTQEYCFVAHYCQ